MNPLRSPFLRQLLRHATLAPMLASLVLPNRLPACTGDECQGCIDDDGYCISANRFSVVNGNANRTIVELSLLGAATGEFAWQRFHNTVPRAGLTPLGAAGNWRHGWQYDLVETLEATGTPKELLLFYPSGRESDFKPATGGGWTAAGKLQEQVKVAGNRLEIVTTDGDSLLFLRQTRAGTARYEIQTLTDATGLVVRFDYDAAGNLVQVTEPAGRYFKLAYTDVSFQRGVWRTFGTVTAAPTAGAWVEFTVPADLIQTSFQHLRLRAARGASLALAELQFYAQGATTPLRGTANGTGSAPEALFDDNPSTVFRGERTEANVCGLDLGAAGKSNVARVRVLASTGEETILAGAVIEGLEMVSTTRPQLTQVTASDGRSVAYDYSVLADPVSGHEFIALLGARYADGSKATYRYDFVRANSRPLLVEADDPRYDGHLKTIRYTYHERLGMIHQEINPATGSVYASMELDQQDPKKRVVNFTDLRQETFRITDDNFRVAVRTDSLGRTTKFEHDTFGRVIAKTDHQGRRTEIAYTATGQVASEKKAGRTERQLTHDAAGRVAQATDRYGRTTQFERDANGRVAREVAPDGTAREFSYDSLGRITRQRERDGAVHQFTYDARGLKTAWTDPTGQIYRYTYDASDRMATITDPLGRVTKHTYDDRNLVTKTVLPDGTTRQFTYDVYGHNVTETDAFGRVAEFGYDALGRVVRHKDFTGGITTYDYTELPQGCGSCTLTDHPSRIVAPDGTVTNLLYDTEGRLLAKTVALGTAEQATTTYAYDSDDHLVSVTDPLGNVSRYTYDDDNHRLTATDPLGRVTKWTYDDRGNVLTEIASGGAVTKHAYDINDRRIATTDANGATTRFTYDEAGRQTSLTDARGNTYRFAYDAAGHKTAMIYPDDSRESWTYNAAGQQATYTTRAGQVKTISYDKEGRGVAEKWSPAGAAPDVSYTYDAAGRLATLSNGISTLRYTYDSLGRMASETTDLSVLLPGASPRTVGYAYDVMGRRTQLTYPDGTVVKQSYNALGQLAAVAIGGDAALATWSYDSGRLAAIARANGVGTTYTYDAAGQLTEVAHRKGDTLLALARYTLDAAGRRTGQTREDGITETYAYDPTGQLTSVDYGTTPARKETFAYDPLGNRVTTTDSLSPDTSAPVSTTYTANSLNQYTQIATRTGSLLTTGSSNSVSLTYDLNGNLTFDGQQTYRYDAQNRLIEVEKLATDSSLRATFHYDARNRCVLRRFYGLGSQGQWVEKTDQSHALTYSDWNLIDERRPDGTLAARYIHGARIDEIVQASLLSTDASSLTPDDSRLTPFYSLADGLGSTLALTDALGTTVQRYCYKAFGMFRILSTDPKLASQGITYRFLFTGREWLASLGLNDHRSRLFATSIGRWLVSDHIRLKDGHNMYSYARNNTFNSTDPNGRYGGSTVCSGPPDNTFVTIVNDPSAIDASCSQDHEDQHVADLDDCCTDSCVGKSYGDTPDISVSIWHETECNAYRVGKSCRESLLQSLTDCSQKKVVAGQIANDVAQIANHCN